MYQEHVETPAVVEQKTLKQRWIEALRSGKYKQCTGRLRIGDRFCALGVLYHVAGVPSLYGGFDVYGRIEARDAAGIDNDVANNIEVLNDRSRLSLSAIADWIEANT